MHFERLRFSNPSLPLIRRDVTLYNTKHCQYTHFHQATELVYIVEGTVRVHINKMRFLVDSGTVIAIPACVGHLFESVSPKCRYTALIFEEDTLYSSVFAEQPLSSITKDKRSAELFTDIIELRSVSTPLKIEQLRCLLFMLLFRLTTLQQQPLSPKSMFLTPEIEKALHYLSRHYREDLRIDNIAEEVGFSSGYLCRKFKRITGQTISEFWTALRCDLARRQLMDGRSVSYAARRSGFSSLNYFSRVYKKFYGISPSAERPDFIEPK